MILDQYSNLVIGLAIDVHRMHGEEAGLISGGTIFRSIPWVAPPDSFLAKGAKDQSREEARRLVTGAEAPSINSRLPSQTKSMGLTHRYCQVCFAALRGFDPSRPSRGTLPKNKHDEPPIFAVPLTEY